jgi:hypothetical protein
MDKPKLVRRIAGPLRRRGRFWGRAMTAGARWAWDVFDKGARVVAIVAVLALTLVSGLLLHRPAFIIGVVAVLAVIAVFAEGAYRVWLDADSAAQVAIRELGAEHSRDAVAYRLDRLAGQCEMLRSEVPPDPGPGPVYTSERQVWIESSTHLREQVVSELRENAEGFVQYWRSGTESLPELHAFDVYANAFVDMSVERLRHIAQRLREGHDDP